MLCTTREILHKESQTLQKCRFRKTCRSNKPRLGYIVAMKEMLFRNLFRFRFSENTTKFTNPKFAAVWSPRLQHFSPRLQVRCIVISALKFAWPSILPNFLNIFKTTCQCCQRFNLRCLAIDRRLKRAISHNLLVHT